MARLWPLFWQHCLTLDLRTEWQSFASRGWLTVGNNVHRLPCVSGPTRIQFRETEREDGLLCTALHCTALHCCAPACSGLPKGLAVLVRRRTWTRIQKGLSLQCLDGVRSSRLSLPSSPSLPESVLSLRVCPAAGGWSGITV